MSPTLFSTIEAQSKPDLTQQLLAAKKNQPKKLKTNKKTPNTQTNNTP